MTDYELVEKAVKALENSYSPYSGFKVGAALLTKDGRVFVGCNIENASYPAGICAERTAIFKAVSEGERKITHIALAAGEEKLEQPLPNYPSPCGICRQVMAEFCEENAVILLAKSEEDYLEYTLSELLPLSFTAKDL